MSEEAPGSSRSRRIAILAPMPSELRPLVGPLGLVRSPDRSSGLRWGTAGRVEIVAALTGIGMRAGAVAAELVLDEVSPDHLLVVGIAGGIGGSVEIGDLVVPSLVSNRDTGETFRPSPLPDVLQRGTLASSDSLVEAPEEAAGLAKQGIVAVDMETAAIAEVCERRGCPWSVLRAISDRADDGTTDASVLSLAGSDGNPDLARLIRFVLTRPHRVPQLVRLGRGAHAATRAAARAAVTAIRSL